MSKNATELKAAIQGLKVGTPYDLRGQKQISFRPPQTEAPLLESPKTEKPQSETPQKEIPRNEVPHFEEAPRSISTQGFFMLAHSTFSEPKLRALPGDAFRVFIWMTSLAWRFENSDGRLRASVSYISEGTGVSQATVSRCLTTLKDQALITPLQINYRQGNLWWVSPLACGGRTPPKSPQPEEPQKKGSQNDLSDPSKSESSSVNSSEQPSQSAGEVISINNSEKSKNSLSAEISSEVIRDYLENLRPARKRESEILAFEELKDDYSESEIETALTWIRTHGLPGSQEYCHSPLAFLGQGMAEVLKLAQTSQEQQDRTSALNAQVQQTRDQGVNQALAQAQELQHQRSEFEKAFSDPKARDEYLQRIHRLFPKLSFSGPALQNLAVSTWWDEQNGRH